MSIIIMKNSTMVRPAEETPSKILWLSRLDMIIREPNSHTRTLFMFRRSESLPPSSASIFFDADVLKDSLSKVLVPFYPFAGRLRMNDNNGRYEIDCSGEGVLFVEAETTLTLDELKPSNYYRSLMAPPCDYSKGLGSFPLIIAQLTRFKCGGVCLCVLSHHHAADAISLAHFNYSWGRLARGLPIGVMPVHDRLAYLGPRHPPQIKFQHPEFQPPLPPLPPKDLSGNVWDTVECVFDLSEHQIDALKQEAVSKETQNEYKLSTFEILAGHVWRCATKARGLADDQDVKLYVPVNLRSWLKDPVLAQGYCGNVLYYPTCTVKAKDMVHQSLGHAASKVHEMLGIKKDGKYLRSAIDYLESQPNLGPFVRSGETTTCPNFSINSWASIPFGEADFGWGKPTFIRHGGIKWEGQAFFIPTTNGDANLSLAIRLFTPHMALFRNYLYTIGDRVKENELIRTSKELKPRL